MISPLGGGHAQGSAGLPGRSELANMKSIPSDVQRGQPAARIRGQSSANLFSTAIAWLIPENLRDDPIAVQRVRFIEQSTGKELPHWTEGRTREGWIFHLRVDQLEAYEERSIVIVSGP